MRGTWQTAGGGGGGGGLLLLLLLLVAALAIGSGAASRITDAIVSLLIIAGVVIVLAVAGIVALLVYRTRSELRRPDRPGAAIAAPVVYEVPRAQPALLEASQPPPAAIEPPREIHLHLTVSPGELAAILRHYDSDG